MIKAYEICIKLCKSNILRYFCMLLCKLIATGEPALCLAAVITHALREAVRFARLDAGYEDKWINIGKI